ncbi:MAG TPA: beta-propeller fold lactonase family protein [Acidobacteriaceae bacterium]|jgi:hypothetical protein|nr:beta-propeller fold lactonase family protein [Acidobacteriaceae bacterium]
MRIRPTFCYCFVSLLSACAAGCGSANHAGTIAANPDASATSPGAPAYAFFGYAGSASSSAGLEEFVMDANGSISNLPGTTLKGSPAGITSNTSYLFVADEDDQSIDAFRISSSALTPAAATSTARQGYPVWLFTDRTGKTLYSWGGSGTTTFASWSIGANGALKLINQVKASINGPWPQAQLSFSGNNDYAYGSTCLNDAPVFYGFARSSSGALAPFNTEASSPAGAEGNVWRPFGAAANGHGFVVIGMTPSQSSAGSLLAVYAIQSNGTLVRRSTRTLPVSAQFLSAYAFDLTGSWLAAGDGAGLHLYHFANGTLNLSDSASIQGGVQQIEWDDNGNVYWLGQACCGSFAVYNVSSSGQLTESSAASNFAPDDPGGEGGTYMQVQPM